MFIFVEETVLLPIYIHDILIKSVTVTCSIYICYVDSSCVL